MNIADCIEEFSFTLISHSEILIISIQAEYIELELRRFYRLHSSAAPRRCAPLTLDAPPLHIELRLQWLSAAASSMPDVSCHWHMMMAVEPPPPAFWPAIAAGRRLVCYAVAPVFAASASEFQLMRRPAAAARDSCAFSSEEDWLPG